MDYSTISLDFEDVNLMGVLTHLLPLYQQKNESTNKYSSQHYWHGLEDGFTMGKESLKRVDLMLYSADIVAIEAVFAGYEEHIEKIDDKKYYVDRVSDLRNKLNQIKPKGN